MGQSPWGRGSTRSSRALRAEVLKRDPICTCFGCPSCSPLNGCQAPSTDDDHIVPLSQEGSDDPSNHRGLCHPCHVHKSQAEARVGRLRLEQKRPARRHPGMN